MQIIVSKLTFIKLNSGSRHQRNRSLDSVLQKIPESEPDGPVSVATGDGLHHHPHHGSVDQASLPHHGHPPLKPSLSLSLDPCSNLFRFKETRRYHQKCLSVFKSSHQLIIKKLSLPPNKEKGSATSVAKPSRLFNRPVDCCWIRLPPALC